MYPIYRFNYPRPAYSFDLRPYYDISEGDPDEAIVNNGTITAAMCPNAAHNGYITSTLRRITSPPYTLGDNYEPTLMIWGFDNDGPHEIKNIEYSMDFSLLGLKAYVENIESDGVFNTNWSASIEYNAIPEKRLIIATITYKNISSRDRMLKIAGYLENPQITYSLDWTQYTPSVGKVNACYKPDTGLGAIETASTDGKAFLIFGFNVKPESYSVTAMDEKNIWDREGVFSCSKAVDDKDSHNQYISYSFGIVPPDASVSVSMVISIEGTLEKARADYIDAVKNTKERLLEADLYWKSRWDQTKYEIQCPDEDINRMSELAMSNGILGHDPVNNVWITSCGRAFRGVTFLWDQYYSNYGLLTGGSMEMVKKALLNTLSMDLTTNNFYGITDKRKLGYHYSYQHYCITSLIYKYVTLYNDIDFLNEKVDNGATVIEILSAQAHYVAYGINFDFGATWETVECVSSYIKDIPDLTANACWMAEKTKVLAIAAGRKDIAASMDPIRDKAYQRLQLLWDPNAKWFKAYQGALTYSCQVYLSILSEVLTKEQIDGLMSRIDDFVGVHGVKSLAQYDPEFVAENSRGDFNGAASYVGTAGEFANILTYLRDKERLYKLVKGISLWWQWRPFQPQGINALTGHAEGLISNEGTNNCASVYMSMVPMNLIGLKPAVGGLDIYECYPEEWTNQAGTVAFNGNTYSAKVSLPYKDYKYTYYVDKPEKGDSSYTYSYASIYTPEGKLIKDWYANRLPDMDNDTVFVLHFDYKKPLIEGIDLLTRVMDASGNAVILENTSYDIRFRLNRCNNNASIKIKGIPDLSYTFYINGQKAGASIMSDKNGSLEYNHTFISETDEFYIKALPSNIVDYAANAEVSAESAKGADYQAKNAVDNNDSTYWMSEKTEMPHWIKLDLGSVKTIDRVDICWIELIKDEYKVQLSKDGYHWTAKAITLDEYVKGLKVHTFEPTDARYVRIFITNRGFTSAGIRSINVYDYSIN